MVEYFDVANNDLQIKCLKYYEAGKRTDCVVLACHGFAGHKESAAIEEFSRRLLEKNPNCTVIAFDLPGHGADGDSRLTLINCDRYYSAVIDYIHTQYKDADICFYGTSFGGYLCLKYIFQHGAPFRKTVLRCPAVNIAETFSRKLINDSEREVIENGGTAQLGFDYLVNVDKYFIDELEKAPVYELDYSDYADDILIIQGTADELLDFGEVKAFADRNNIRFVVSRNADHRFLDENRMREAIDLTISFMGFDK